MTNGYFTRTKNSVNGAPRYVLHYLAFNSDYDIALKIAKKAGFSKYRGKDFGGGFVCQSYNLCDTIERIEKVKAENK